MEQLRDTANKGPAGQDLLASGMPCIEIERITVRFAEKTVIEDFSLSVGCGESAIIMGPSGRGKSTLLRCILGFVVPVSGSVKICGETVRPETIWYLRTLVSYVPQEPELGNGTVQQWLERPFGYKANKEIKDNLEKIPEMFNRFLLPMELLEKDVNVLSGGEKQRVAIVSALVLGRPILLLDEPTSALDDLSKKRLIEYLSRVSGGETGNNGLTILAVSHDPGLIAIADKVINLD
ncbi:MAG: hypothetical protein DRH12_03745 [Deltaproteobacteria bacterium]|nr:MAG: hypothetical protein DRH12_03745 [Deltaproteobacteria bacterium]